MRLFLILFVLLGVSVPAAADTPSHLRPLEQQLRYLEASNPGTSVSPRSTSAAARW
jgi:hypothetical protein